MAEIDTVQKEWEGQQMQPNQKHKKIYETQPNQKAIEWLETQTHQKEWEGAQNGEPIVVINHLNGSEHDILTMVEQVLTKNEFSDDSSIFVIVSTIDNDAGNSSHRHSNVCMQMSEKPVTKKKANPVGRDPQHHRNSTPRPDGVKLSSKGKMFFMEVLPTDIQPYHNKKEILCDRQNPTPKGDWKKGTKNKLCQITTPNSIVERVENRRNGVSMDTTIDRPCCCSAKPNQLFDYNPNDRQVANVMSNVTPQGIIGTSFNTGWRMTTRESVKSAKLPLAPCDIPQCRLHRTPQLFTRAPIQQRPCAPTHQSARALSEEHTRAPIQRLTCAPTHLTWELDRQYAEACPTQNCGEACPTQRRAETCLTQNRDEASPSQRRCAEACPTLQHTEARSTQQSAEPCPIQHLAGPMCQCSPEQLLELFKLAVTGGKLYGIPTICGECPEPEILTQAPPAEPAEPAPCEPAPCEPAPCEPAPCEPSSLTTATTEPTCPCVTTSDRMQIEMGETKQKRGSIRQTKFSATVGTSTDAAAAKPPRKSGWWSWRKNICECPIKEPEPVPEKPKPEEPKPEEPKSEEPKPKEPKPDYDLEPNLTRESYFREKDSLILSPELLKKSSDETQRVSGFRLQQDKRLPPEPVPDFTAEDAIRYLAMMNPDIFNEIMAEQQAKLDGTYKPPPPPPPAVEPPKPDTKADEGFKGLKFKVGGKGSGSKGLAGVCCFDLLTESFTTW